jgi:hypothetical protein
MLKDAKPPEPILRPPGEDRRQWVRYPIRLPTSCRVADIVDGSSWLAQIQNISHEGVKISCRHSKLLPRLARVVHVENGFEGNWIIGCTFTRELMDERELLAWLKSQNGKSRAG